MPITPYASTQGWTPKEDDYLIVNMPGEIQRCQVVKVIEPNRVMARVVGVPMSKTHMFRKDDIIGVRRGTQFGRTVWEACDDREFIANRSPSEPPPPVQVKPPETPKPAPKKKVAPKKGKRVA